VVNAAQSLMAVVPKSGGIEVEANVLNKDVGFLQIGMPVTVKLDAFEFTKFGSLKGTVQWIAADAVKIEQVGQVFPVRIVLQETMLPISVNGVRPEIRIGMSLVADIAIGKRKAYEYFLGPLLRYQNESLRER
jgi:multidrug efflux pump subunit AcrA (membrane-fusion protein)